MAASTCRILARTRSPTACAALGEAAAAGNGDAEAAFLLPPAAPVFSSATWKASTVATKYVMKLAETPSASISRTRALTSIPGNSVAIDVASDSCVTAFATRRGSAVAMKTEEDPLEPASPSGPFFFPSRTTSRIDPTTRGVSRLGAFLRGKNPLAGTERFEPPGE